MLPPSFNYVQCFVVRTGTSSILFQTRQMTHIINRCPKTSRRLLTTAVSDIKAKPGSLYVVSTPIGHLQDISMRARGILSTVDTIAAEDTRVTVQLLNLLSIKRPNSQTLLSCHAHNFQSRIPTLLSKLSSGCSVALVSDAGTPCVSDPGAEIVAAAIKTGVPIIPIPGPCAAVTALAASGLPATSFLFLGFLPRTSQRTVVLDTIERNPECTIILYEAPHRLRATLLYLTERPVIQGRRICLGRELTKKWEEFLRFDNVLQVMDHFSGIEPRGEFTIILAPAAQQSPQTDSLHAYKDAATDIPALVECLVRSGLPASTVARTVASCSNVPKKLVYAFATDLKNSLAAEDNLT